MIIDPATILVIANFAIEFGVPAGRKLAAMFRKPAPTWDDWDEVFDLAEKPFDDYVKPTPTP